MPARILLPLIVACALFMENFDSTVISTALPAIAADFGASPIHLKLALTSYLLAIAVFLPASGWLADRFGARLIFRLAILIFTLGSIGCGLSSSIGEIVAARIFQGFGGAMMVPVGRLVILRSVEKSELVGALSWLTVPALIGPVVGPPVGGFITTYFEWRWIFWVNIPVGILGLVLATLFIPDVRGDVRAFDLRGFLLSGFGLAGFLAGSTSFGLGLLPKWQVLTMIIGGATLLALYYVHSRRVPNPILDLTLLKVKTFGLSIVGGLFFRTGVGASPFLLPLMLQIGFGMSPFHSGLVTFVSAVGAIAMKFTAPPLLRRYGFRRVLLWNTFIAAAFVAMPAAFTPMTPVIFMSALLLVSGFFRSLQFTAVNALSYADIAPERMSRGTTMSAVAQQIAQSVGISTGALVLEIVTGFGAEPITASAFPPAFLVVAVLSIVSVVPFLFLSNDDGQEMSGHGRGRTSRSA